MRFLVLMVVLLIAGCPADKPTNEIKDLISTSVVIDVRTPQEFNEGHIEGAVNIPYTDIGDRISDIASDKDQSIVLYCRSGRRSGIALNTLKDLGYTRLVNAGGYAALKQKLGQ